MTIVLTTYSEKAPALVQTVTPADTTEWVRSKLSGYDVIGMKEFETLTVEAAVTGNLVAAKRGLILNPIVDTGTVLDDALKETVKENLDYMPQFRWMFDA